MNHTGDGCNLCGPSWWGLQRGCYEAAKRRYGEQVRSSPITSGSPDHDHLKSLGFSFDRLGDPIWEKK